MLEKISNVAYKLRLPEITQIHPVFHVSLLKKHIGEILAITTKLPLSSNDGQLIFEPELILDMRWIKKGSNMVEEFLIKWKKMPHEDAKWEDATTIRDAT